MLEKLNLSPITKIDSNSGKNRLVTRKIELKSKAAKKTIKPT
jgi:hypothetical protein